MSSNKALMELNRSWGWLLGLGILFVLMGLIGLGMVFSLTIASVMVFGLLSIVAGIIQIIDASRDKQWTGSFWHIFIGILYLIAGGIMIYDPVLASTVITAFIAWILIVIGVSRLIMLSNLRRHARGWGWLVVSAITAIILGVLILIQWPYSALWVLGMFIAIELLVAGWTYIFIAVAIRNK